MEQKTAFIGKPSRIAPPLLGDAAGNKANAAAKTGDTANMLLPMIAAMLAGTAVVGTISIRRRRR